MDLLPQTLHTSVLLQIEWHLLLTLDTCSPIHVFEAEQVYCSYSSIAYHLLQPVQWEREKYNVSLLELNVETSVPM